MKKKLVFWILQTGEPLPCDGKDARPMRAINLCEELISRGHKVVLWSAQFDHAKKIHRKLPSNIFLKNGQLEIRLIDSPGYQSNIGLGRLWDHAVLAWHLWRLLRRDDVAPPDVGFIGYPPIEIAYVMAKWLNARGVPYLVDVKDQWPDIFLDPLPGVAKGVFRLFLWPYYFLGRAAMKSAVGLTAMTQPFLSWASGFCRRENLEFSYAVPLTAPRFKFDKKILLDAEQWWKKKNLLNNVPIIFFVGNLSSKLYEFSDVFSAAKFFSCRSKLSCQFVICGDGVYMPELKAMAKECDNIFLVGTVTRSQIKALANRSLGMLAPYRSTPDFQLSVPNKILDSLSLGMPVISSLKGEVENLIKNKKIGIFYNEKNVPELIDAIHLLLKDSEFRERLSESAKNLYEMDYSFERVYGELASNLEKIARIQWVDH